MDQKYVSYYFRNLCVDTFPSYGAEIYYEMCIYEHFFELLLRVADFKKEFNMLVFVDRYLKKLDSDKYKKKFEAYGIKSYDAAKNDFLILLSNLYQITLIYNHKNNLLSLEEKLLSLDSDRLEKIRIHYKLNETRVSFIEQVLEKLKYTFSAKIDFKYDINEYYDALSNTLTLVEDKLKQLKIEDIVFEKSAEVDGYRQKVFEACKGEVIDNLQNLTGTIGDAFFNERKIRHLKRVDYYLSFLMHDEIVPLEGSKNIFRNFYKALMYAYKMQMYFLYFKDKYEQVTLAKVLEFFDDETLTVGSDKDYIDRRAEEVFFNIVDNIEVRRDFKHLPLIVLGSMLSLDAKTVEKMSIQLDNDGLIGNNRTKNPNVISRFKDLRHSANSQTVYDLDDDTRELLEYFNSYKIETVFEANVVDEEGELDKMSFDSEEDYINHIRPHCDEGDIQYMVDNFLRKRDKKAYYEPLFTADI